MGLLPRDFWELRPVDYARMIRGYYIREERKWLHTRKILASLHNAFAEAGNALTEQQILPLPYFDNLGKTAAKPRKKTWTKEELDEIARRLK